MATRRPPSSRPTSNPKPAMAPPTRSRSAMSSRPASMIRTNDEQPLIKPTPAPRIAHRNEEPETNIKVVVRCRSRSEREIQENSPVIITSNGAKSEQVSIELSPPQSTFGVAAPTPVRTYPFDIVFGPEADQGMVYHEVVNPMLEQVLEGYNCTLFAYGQTGTGKTYTMHGDLVPTPMGNPSTNAGMVPRVLFRLFHYLEKQKADFSVKVSYIELYNEELRDLLAPELAAPTGSSQPMALGAKDSSKPAEGGLKIYEDPVRGGIFIQGIQEISVKNCAQTLDLLTIGSHRRQIAATRFNDHSSRSHSIFTLSVTTRDETTVGQDLLKVGKFNLVDLAGSENIGRSGAENKRAREAGMINQSLLTLGRVINSLVDRSSHVPYRESKLTRILQDSLGGHTKTCIIATVSPARSNLEETLSTLDYAMHAKSIKNKPELNQRVIRSSLLQEYEAEIELLKADLRASREKTGIYVSEETWAQRTTEQELRQTELNEAKKKVEILEKRNRDAQEELDQSFGMLMKREAELKETKEKLVSAEGVLVQKGLELKGVKVALEEEIVVRKAFEKTEDTLNVVASGLREIASQSAQDVNGLFEKLERKSAVLNSNAHAVQVHGKTIASATSLLSLKLEEFVQSCTSGVSSLRHSSQQLEANQKEALDGYVEGIDRQRQDLETAFQSMRSLDSTEAQAVERLRKVVGQTHDSFQSGYQKWMEKMNATNQQIHVQLDETLANAFTEFDSAIKALYSFLGTVLTSAVKFVESERESALAAHKLVSGAAESEISRLRQQNESVTQILELQKAESAKAIEGLMQTIFGHLQGFAKGQDQSLRKAIIPITSANELAIESMASTSGDHKRLTDKMESDGVVLSRKLEKAKAQSKAIFEQSNQSTITTKANVQTVLSGAKRKMSDEIDSHFQTIQEQTQTMSTSCTEAFTAQSRAKKSRLEVVDKLGRNLQSEFSVLSDGLAGVSKDLQDYTEGTASKTTHLEEISQSYRANATSDLTSLKQGHAALRQEATKEDVPTGGSPRRRKWQYADTWELTKSRDVLLQEWRASGSSAVGSETFLAEHLPLPTDDVAMEEEEDDDKTSNELTPAGSPRDHAFPSSLQTSTSSTASTTAPQQIQLPPVKVKSKISTARLPLVDSRHNTYTTRTSSRRPR